MSWDEFEKSKKLAEAYMVFKRSPNMNNINNVISYDKLRNVLANLSAATDIVRHNIKDEDFVKYLTKNGFYLQENGIGFSRKLDVYISDIEYHRPNFPSCYRLWCPVHEGFLSINLDPSTNDHYLCNAYRHSNEAHSYTLLQLEQAVKNKKIMINSNFIVEIHDIKTNKKITDVSIDSGLCSVMSKPEKV